MKRRTHQQFIRTLFLLVLSSVGSLHTANAQGTAFTYQGRLTDAGTLANGNYDMQFQLFAAVSGGTQIGGTITNGTVAVANGIFTVQIDFGANFPGANRFLEIRVRPAGSGTPYTILAPRQPITATPYAIRSASAASADNATTATNATQLGGVAASQYVLTTDTRLADARPPTSGSANYIKNSSSPQTASNFNISGNGTAGGTLAASTVNAALQFNLGGARILSNPGTGNLFAGVAAGSANTTGPRNTFLGVEAGMTQTTANGNTFVGYQAGRVTTSSFNTFVGDRAGNVNSTGAGNSFFGNVAGSFSTTGSNNSFFGFAAGQNNQIGSNNAFFGSVAGQFNRGDSNSFFGTYSGQNNDEGEANSFFGAVAGLANTSGFANSFLGESAGASNTTGFANSFFGKSAGSSTTTGGNNSFFGTLSGSGNLTGGSNTLIGDLTDVATGNLSFATAIGAGAVVSTSNTIMLGRAGQDNVVAANRMAVRSIPLLASGAAVCFNAAGDLLQCGASSLRLKQNVQPYRHGLDIVLRLRPISFNWKENGLLDFGLGAEDVAQVAPSFVFTDDEGAAKGVKYERLNVLLINAVKEQQAQIQEQQELIRQQRALAKRQQQELDALKNLICQLHPRTKVCR